MPGVIPRLNALLTSGFGQIAYLMAFVYNMVRLIPDGHPYLNSRNIGQFGIRHVIAAAANRLIVNRKNIDQIVVFTLLLVGTVLLGLMLALLLVTLMFKTAHAANPAFASMFITPQPANDIAFMLLDQVFGIPLFFNSCVAQNVACFPGQTPAAAFPWAFHLALQELFKFYSSGILVIGALIVLYYIIVVVVETAASGSPFGQRFKNMWVPVRLVVAVGLLIPLNYGYNSAQYITFGAAKFGSGLATNAWNVYNKTISDTAGAAGANPTGERESLVALPNSPDASTFLQMMSIVHACAFGYYLEDTTIDKGNTATGIPLPHSQGNITKYLTSSKVQPYVIKNPQAWMTDNLHFKPFKGLTYEDALAFAQKGDIIIRFGKRTDTDKNGTVNDQDDIEPTCGDVRIIISDHRTAADLAGTPSAGAYLGPVEVQKYFYKLIQDMWFDANRNYDLIQFAGRAYLLGHSTPENPAASATKVGACDMGCNPQAPDLPSCTGASPYYVPKDKNANKTFSYNPACKGQPIGAIWKLNRTKDLQGDIDGALETIWDTYNKDGIEIQLQAGVAKYGWGGAGIWYNTLAQVNGAFTQAFINYPNLDKYPKIMAQVASLKKTNNPDGSGASLFNPNMGTDQASQITASDPNGMALALGMYAAHEYWNKDGSNNLNPEKLMSTGALENAMNLVFGTQGLFSMLTSNAHVHPLAQLVSLGKGLVEASIRNIAGSTLIASMGGILGALEPSLGPLAPAASGFLSSTAFIGLTAGFVLFYVLPFLPFVYFYFALATWIKTIFEAMVGVPLWALAHLRLDGEGLPGDAAANGYFLIFDIFIRPILSIVGLIAGMLIFTAQVRILHFSWMLVTENAGAGVDDPAKINIVGSMNINRSIVDEFFYTVVYAIIVYMMATASFKLIDKIPDNLLRWMGQGVPSFSATNDDATEGLTRYAAVGGMQAGQKISSGLTELGSGLGGAMSRVLTPK
jgi:hypothetical protein